MKILNKITGAPHSPLSGGPFTAAIQIRFKKPANTAQTRLETRALDSKLDRLAFHHRRLSLVLSLYNIVSTKKRGPSVSLNLLTWWAPIAGINTLTAGEFLRRYPHVFVAFTHPERRNTCCKFTPKFVKLLKVEDEILSNSEDAVMTQLGHYHTDTSATQDGGSMATETYSMEKGNESLLLMIPLLDKKANEEEDEGMDFCDVLDHFPTVDDEETNPTMDIKSG